jgi:hypothetical protein
VWESSDGGYSRRIGPDGSGDETVYTDGPRGPGRGPTPNRLASHASGRRSGDQFCVYVADRLVMPELTSDGLEAIAAGGRMFGVFPSAAEARPGRAYCPAAGHLDRRC